MTTATLPNKAGQQVVFFASADFAPPPPKGHWYAKDDGTKAFRQSHVAIFRSGEFTDSMGMEHVYEDIHMQMIVTNFSLLRSSGTFVDPPVRCDHRSFFGGGLNNVIGYIDNLVAEKAVSPVDGTEYTYVFADFDVLDEDAGRKIQSGLWRHRSAEIGWYETNSHSEFWPVMLGVAYVDIPAVEGLNGFSKFAKSLPGVGERFSAVAADNKEEPPVGDETTDQQPQGGTTPPASTDSTGGATSPEDSPPPTGQSQPPADPDAGNVQVTSQHATGTTTHTFTIAGVATTDFAAVQAHITELENFEKETLAAARDSYVAKLADDQKIFSSQTASLQKLVRNMTEEQFGDFKESYNNSPKLPTLATHAVTPQAGGTPEGQGGHEDPEVEQARRVYNRHLQMGLPKDQLENTDSYKLLKDKGIV